MQIAKLIAAAMMIVAISGGGVALASEVPAKAENLEAKQARQIAT